MSKQPAFETARLAEIERPDGWAPIRSTLGVASFGINAFTAADSGATLIPEHDERSSGHEELYLVTAGEAEFTVAGEIFAAPVGTVVLVREPAAPRAAVASAPATTVIAVGGLPGGPYAPRSWEASREAFDLFDDERFAEARAMLVAALGRYEDRGTLLYNIACADARLGDAEAAVGGLRAALAEDPSLAEFARQDEDLVTLRDDERLADVFGE